MHPPLLTRELLEAILARIPEGFVDRNHIEQRCQVARRGHDLDRDLLSERCGRTANWYYDRSRLRPEQVRQLAAWCRPEVSLPEHPSGFREAPIEQRRAARAAALAAQDTPGSAQLLARVERTRGYLPVELLLPEETPALQVLLERDWLRRTERLVYDPLLLGARTVERLDHEYALCQPVVKLLETSQAPALPLEDVARQVDIAVVSAAQAAGYVVFFTASWRTRGREQSAEWLRLPGTDPTAAQEYARVQAPLRAADKRRSEEAHWRSLLDQCGTVLRPGAREGKSSKAQVIARTYLPASAARRVGVTARVMLSAIEAGAIAVLRDPGDRVRVPAGVVETLAGDAQAREALYAFETLKVRDLALVSNVAYSTARRRLERAGLSRTAPLWGEVRGQWGLPATWPEFRALAQARRAAWLNQLRTAWPAGGHCGPATPAEDEQARQAREELRAKLLAVFPTWQHAQRGAQRLGIHLGPPNSGKTFRALEHLVAAGSGWYLAPLRLLAFEVSERLNARGVPCNLLTGEEALPVPGAQITAATIEMFSPAHSGQCVVIDEAQMLADAQRGWAWTRALMEAEAPAIHVVGPPGARDLLGGLAEIAGLPLQVEDYERMAPIAVADQPWPLGALPPRTILVAFSRQAVLEYKTALEQQGRSVAVVYGDLPPETRRRQAERFASGAADICVATDAVGMGLNLPADAVCFSAVEKYDGRRRRGLTPAELQQIGGRAGRYGLSRAGLIGGLSHQILGEVRRLYHMGVAPLRMARVAPTAQALDLIPGRLAERLAQWAALSSIPDHLRSRLATVDLEERIALARLLTRPEEEALGLERALTLINAPARESTTDYWRACATALVAGRTMPRPPEPERDQIRSARELEAVEICIHRADLYLWLGQRPAFTALAPASAAVRRERAAWSQRIDEALQRAIDTARHCSECGARLPLGHRYGLCNACYQGRFTRGWEDDWGCEDEREPR